MERQIALSFRNQLRQAREKAFQDAEAFECIIHVVERLGSYCCRDIRHLGEYKKHIVCIASASPLAEVPENQRGLRTPFPKLYDIVKDARNDAFHQGAFARHLTTHAVQLALVLEDALQRNDDTPAVVGDFMVSNPVCAELWQPIGYIRQQLLVNSFSYLPVQDEENEWRLISDLEVAKYLQKADGPGERKRRLAQCLKDAMTEIELLPATCHYDNTPAADVIDDFDGKPILVRRCHDGHELVGILTAFDLL